MSIVVRGDSIMATAAKFRIDVAIHDLLMNSSQRPPAPPEPKGLTLPEPVFPQYPDRLKDPGPEIPPDEHRSDANTITSTTRAPSFPNVRAIGNSTPTLPTRSVELKRTCNKSCLIIMLIAI